MPTDQRVLELQRQLTEAQRQNRTLRTALDKYSCGLTVADVNAINQIMEQASQRCEEPERKRIADLSWKLVFLGQAIEQSDKIREELDSAN